MEIDPLSLGRALRELRERKQLTQRELAEQLGLTVNYLSLVENGKRGVSIQTLNEFANALDVPAPLIACLGTAPPDTHSATGELLVQIQNLIRITASLPGNAHASSPSAEPDL